MKREDADSDWRSGASDSYGANGTNRVAGGRIPVSEPREMGAVGEVGKVASDMANGADVPEVQAPQLREYLQRHSLFARAPEAQLVIEMIVKAWVEAMQNGNIGKKARVFFNGGLAQFWGDLIGFEDDIERIYARHHPRAGENRDRAKRRHAGGSGGMIGMGEKERAAGEAA